jgi:IS4 transposase
LEGVLSDQVGCPSLPKAATDFPYPLRRVRYFDAESSKHLVFLTNNLEIPALTVAKLYKARWQIELFFKWIKGHLRIKHYFGTSPNAVKTQIWIAVAVYLMVAILHKQLQLPGKLHRTFQLLSIHPFEKVPIHELLTETDFKSYMPHKNNQLMLWDL